MSVEERAALSKRLAMNAPDRHAATAAAHAYGMTPSWMRTLRRRARAGTPVRPIGRPRIPEAERQRVAQLVRAQRDEQGQDAGARPIGATLSRTAPGVGRDLVEEALSAQKQADRAAARAATDAQRVSLEVLGRDTVWTADVTHGGRLGDGTAVEGEVIRDRATLATPRAAFGPMPTAADVIAGLEAVAKARGGWPLVYQVDNGSIYTSALVRDRLAAEQVILLYSRVHTPTDNPAIEHAHHELKAQTGLGKRARIASVAEAQALVNDARRRLDHGRRRATRGWHTADELDRIVPRADTQVDRAAFCAAARSAMATAVIGLEQDRARRAARRNALIETMIGFGLARRHRGRRPRTGPVPMPVRIHPAGACAQNG